MKFQMELKTALWFGGILLIILSIPAGILFYQNHKLQEELSTYVGQEDLNYKRLTDSLQRAETTLAKNTEELDLFAQQNEIDLKTVREDLQSLGGHLEAVASSGAKTTTIIKNYIKSDNVTPSEIEVPICKEDGRPIDINGYTKTTEQTYITDSNGMRIADVSFSAAQKNPWGSKVYGIRYKILNTVGRDKNNRIILSTELQAENPEAQPGKIFRIEGTESRVLQAPPNPASWDWWDPSLYLLAQLSLIVYQEVDFSASLAIGFSIFSYGENWRFLGVSAGYDAFQNAFRASFIPFLYNVGGPLPFFSDLYIGAEVGLSHELDISVGLTIGTRL